MDHYRQRKKMPPAQGGSSARDMLAQHPTLDIEEESNASEDVQLLYCRILYLIRNEFSDTNWRAFEMAVVEDIRPAEAAQALGISRNQVYLAKSRILKRLREEFDIPPVSRDQEGRHG
jgi:RNA polymerase sigma-70 factor (ECF subfamily)